MWQKFFNIAHDEARSPADAAAQRTLIAGVRHGVADEIWTAVCRWHLKDTTISCIPLPLQTLDMAIICRGCAGSEPVLASLAKRILKGIRMHPCPSPPPVKGMNPATHPVLIIVRRRNDGLLPPPAPRGALRIEGPPRAGAAAAAVVGAVVMRVGAARPSPRRDAVALPLVLVALILRQVLTA